jgi:chromate transporter
LPARAGADDTRTPLRSAEALKFWLKLGFISFGGPAGQIAIMHRELVEQKRWISERRFLHALNYCMVLPGPEAQQLATYIGWLMHRTWGGVVAGGAVRACLAADPRCAQLGLRGVRQRGLGGGPVLRHQAAVAAIVLQAVWRIGSRTLSASAQGGRCCGRSRWRASSPSPS